MSPKAFQDYYPDHLSYCYGCAASTLTAYASRVTGTATKRSAPSRPARTHRHSRLCIRRIDRLADRLPLHGTAAAASYRTASREMDTEPPFRFVTASLHVNYLRPTPLGVPLEIRARVTELKAARWSCRPRCRLPARSVRRVKWWRCRCRSIWLSLH